VFAAYRDSFLVNPGDIDPWWLSILAILPALLATILVFLDQQITAVIVNRKEHKLKVSKTTLADIVVTVAWKILHFVVYFPRRLTGLKTSRGVATGCILVFINTPKINPSKLFMG